MESSPFAGRRVPVPSDPAQFITTRPLGSTMVRVVEPAVGGLDVSQWIASQRAWLDRMLLAHGALLFRGFDCLQPERFEGVIAASGRPAFAYTYRSTPRRVVRNAIFSSTEYPADQAIPMHNEMSYTTAWPGRLWLCCLTAAAEGGETPLADSAAVWRRIPEPVRERFRRHGVRYVRNYGTGLDLPWQEVFQTADRHEVEVFCRAAGISFDWVTDTHLRTAQVCQSEIEHPVTKAPVWFNQAHLFHVSSLGEHVSSALIGVAGVGELPRNAYFGDGSEIPEGMLDVVRAAYDAESIRFSWQAGDLLVVDNVAVAHGRMPFRGQRRVVVGMTT
jgi:alpha-ketoglutarate-dependent taurine dioxygenase